MKIQGKYILINLVLVLCYTYIYCGEYYQIKDIIQENELLRAIHMGGNWGDNRNYASKPPKEYLDYLHNLNTSWVGISVALHIENSMDSTVERDYEDVSIPTFEDEVLIGMLREFKKYGFNVYLTLAFETQDASKTNKPVNRWQLGDPKIPKEDPNIKSENWPWALDHPEHENFVNTFWATYTSQAAHYANICEVEDVELFSIGTETDRLFRTQTGGYWPNNYKDQIQYMVDSIRQVYSGLISYDMHYNSILDRSFLGPAVENLWSDVGLDVIGISAYFPLAKTKPTTIITSDTLEARWNSIFTDRLIPLSQSNPNKPILFLEFGYVDQIGSPSNPAINEFKAKQFQDRNSNGLDDGEETQANIYTSFFDVNSQYSNLVQAAFLWGNQMTTNQVWENSFADLVNFSIRGKLAEDSVRVIYADHTPVPNRVSLLSPPDSSQGLSTSTIFSWEVVDSATSYQFQIANDTNFSTVEIDKINLYSNSIKIENLFNNIEYYWRVRAINGNIAGDWSPIYSFTTIMEVPTPPILLNPKNYSTISPEDVTFIWTSSPKADSYNFHLSQAPDFKDTLVFKSNIMDTSCTIDSLVTGNKFYWRVKANNTAGAGDWSETSSFNTSPDETVLSNQYEPTRFNLRQNFPNPFNLTTIISYALPNPSYVTLDLYNINGEPIERLIDKFQKAGYYSATWDPKDHSSGVYFYKLKARDNEAIKKCLLIK